MPAPPTEGQHLVVSPGAGKNLGKSKRKVLTTGRQFGILIERLTDGAPRKRGLGGMKAAGTEGLTDGSGERRPEEKSA